MKSICKKFIIGLSTFLIVNSYIPFTSVMALEKPTPVGVSKVINIQMTPSLSGTSIQVPLELNREEKVVLVKSEPGKSAIAGNLYNMQNQSVGIIHIEMMNNVGNTQLTSKVINNNILQLSVQAKDTSNMIHIQVKMTATSFSTYFTNSEWIDRSGTSSLSLSQKQNTTSSTDPTLQKALKIDAWGKVIAKHNKASNWYNSGGMQDQFDCHFDFAKNKKLWNLEPSRPDVDYFSTVAASCNPK